MKRNSQVILYLGGAILLWSTIATAFKVTLRFIDPFSMVLFSALVSTTTLLAIVIRRGQFRILLRQTRSQYLNALLCGMINPALYYLILFKAYDLLPAQIAQPLNYTWPIFLTLLAAIVLKQAVALRSYLAILISFGGIIIITSQKGPSLDFDIEPTGIALALASALVWAAYWILNLRRRGDAVILLTLNFIFGSILIVVFLFLIGYPIQFKWQGMLGSVYIGLFEMGITFFLWLRALQLSPSTAKVSNYIYLTPFVSLIFIALIAGEAIRPLTIPGLFLIITGIILQKNDARKFKS